MQGKNLLKRSPTLWLSPKCFVHQLPTTTYMYVGGERRGGGHIYFKPLNGLIYLAILRLKAKLWGWCKWLLLGTKGWTHSTHLKQSFGLLKVPPKGLVIITPQFVHTSTPIPHTHIHTRIHTHCLMKPRSYGCGQLKTGMDFFRPLGDGDPNTTVFPPKTTRSSPLPGWFVILFLFVSF